MKRLQIAMPNSAEAPSSLPSGYTPSYSAPEELEVLSWVSKNALAAAPEPPTGPTARPYAGCPRHANGTNGKLGGWVPSGKATVRSPSRNRSAASRYSANTQEYAAHRAS